MEILIAEAAHRRVQAELERIAPHATSVILRDDGSLLREGRGVSAEEARLEIAWASRDLFDDLEHSRVRDFMVTVLKSDTLRWFQSGGAGVDHPVFGMISRKGVRLTNSDAGSVAIAEFVLAAVIDHYQPNPQRREAQADRCWKRFEFREIAGTTWLVIGLGNIGREVALRAGAFGAHVIGVRREPSGDEPVAEMIRPRDVKTTLPRADVVVLCTSLNPSSTGLVDSGFLSAMKPRSVLVNIARGGLVDEQALLESLDAGIPEYAVLDVFNTEPLPTDDPLWNHRRVRLTSHCAAEGSGSGARGDHGFLANLERYVAGKPLAFELDPASFDSA